MWPGRPDGSGRRGAKVGEQTRFYGDTYDWAFQNATVASLLAASVFFPRGLRRKCFAGGGVATDVPQPGGKEISDQLGECTASLRVRGLWFRLRRAGKYAVNMRSQKSHRNEALGAWCGETMSFPGQGLTSEQRLLAPGRLLRRFSGVHPCATREPTRWQCKCSNMSRSECPPRT